MIRIDKNKHALGLVNKLLKDRKDPAEIINKLREIENEESFSLIKDRIINVIIDATECIELGTPVCWGDRKDVCTKRELWKQLNEIGVYYTVPFWKLDKTIGEIIQTRRAKQALIDKEQKLINQLLKN